jgi:hypothetical protein
MNSFGTIFGTRSTTAGAGGSAQLVRSVKVGDEVKILTHVKSGSFDITDIDSVKVYHVDLVTSGYQVPDSEFYSESHSTTSFLGSSGVMRDFFRVTDGQFKSGTVKDNLRIGSQGYFVDKAGNLSAATFSLDIHFPLPCRNTRVSRSQIQIGLDGLTNNVRQIDRPIRFFPVRIDQFGGRQG